MINSPLISVIMPVYNGEKFISQAISSILNQTITDFEFIIINDGSTDNTENIILTFDDPRIIYLKNETNLKIIKTLNKGLSLARGKFISRMDSDDIAVNNLFEKQLQAFKSDESIDIVNICTYDLSEDGQKYRNSPRPLIYSPEILKYILIFQNQITHPGIMVKTEKIKLYGYKDDESVYNFEDLDLWLRMTWDGAKCVTLNEKLLFYRLNHNGTTRTFGNKRNILRVDYSSQFIKEHLGITINKDYLYLLYGDVSNHKYNQAIINKLIKEIESFIMRSNDKIHVKEFSSWYKIRIATLTLQIVRRLPFKYKIKGIKNIIINPYWFLNKAFLKYSYNSIRNKWIIK